jgi:hypothetical protein
MRATRGLLASLGASTSLVLATAVALFSVSTIVAFRGWPGIDGSIASPGEARIAVSAAEPGGGPAATRAQRIVVPRVKAAPRRALSAARTQRASVATRVPAVVSRPRSTARRRVPTSAAAPPSTEPPQPAPVARPKRSLPPAGDPVREVGTGLGGAVGGVAGGLGEIVRPLSPALGATADQAGRSLDETIRGVTDAVGALLDALLSGSPR